MRLQEQPRVLRCLITGSDFWGTVKERRAVRQDCDWGEMSHSRESLWPLPGVWGQAGDVGRGTWSSRALSLDPRAWPDSPQVGRSKCMVSLSIMRRLTKLSRPLEPGRRSVPCARGLRTEVAALRDYGAPHASPGAPHTCPGAHLVCSRPPTLAE